MSDDRIRTIAITDVETTGLESGKHCVIEVAVVRYDLELMSILGVYSSLIRQGDVMAHGNPAENINGITKAHLMEAPSQDGVWHNVANVGYDSDAFVAHRALFDRSFFPRTIRESRPWACTKYGVTWPAGAYGDSLLPLVNAHRAALSLPSRSQQHRALGDCLLIVDLLEAAKALGADVRTLVHDALDVL